MNVDNVKNNVKDRANRIKTNLPRTVRTHRGKFAALGGLPVVIGAILVALRSERVRNALYRMIPQARSFVDRMYGKAQNIGMGDMNPGRKSPGMPTHERTTYGEA